MPSFNQVILAGHMTRDVELRYTPNGSPVGDFGIAVNRYWKNEKGEKQEEVCFIDVCVWGSQAENASANLGKGSALMVIGRLRFDQWNDNSGQKRSRHRVVAERLVYLDPPKRVKDDARPGAVSSNDQSGKAEGQQANEQSDNIPF